MLKYNGYDIVFSEIPDEISLAISLTKCPFLCPECHSPELRQDIGEELTVTKVLDLYKEHPYCTVILFMGGDSQIEDLNTLVLSVQSMNSSPKFGWYSGHTECPSELRAELFDYIKLGPYIKECGPLNNLTTNQKLYWRDRKQTKWQVGPPYKDWSDITYKFWK